MNEPVGFRATAGFHRGAVPVDGLAGAERDDACHPEFGGAGSVVEILKRLWAAPARVEEFLHVLTADARMIILTGPNMAGKSTYIRQVALIALLAHLGCWVPATQARIGLVDRIFCRVGASDELSRGNSTFMVEMNETANILNNATARSLVVLDEIGRGTSTYDGISIAWAVAEHLHGEGSAGPRTLFATHYHELTKLAADRPRLRNWSVAVKEWQDEIVFVRRVVPGAADRSYGIQVARLAGMPPAVVQRAREILGGLEAGSGLPAKTSAAAAQIQASVAPKKAPPAKPAGKEAGPELDLFA